MSDEYSYDQQRFDEAEVNRTKKPWTIPDPNAGKDLHCKCGHTKSDHRMIDEDERELSIPCTVPNCPCVLYQQKWYGCPRCGEQHYKTFNLKTIKIIDKYGHPRTIFQWVNSETYPLSSKWDEQWYKCVKCGMVYDRRRGLV